MSELLISKYQERQKELADLSQIADEQLKRSLEETGNSYKALEALFRTPSIFLPDLMNQATGSEEAFFDLAKPAAEIWSSRDFVLKVLNDLYTASSWEARGFKEIPLDQRSNIPSRLMRYIFQNHRDVLDSVTNQGKTAGIPKVLSLLEGPVGLHKYRRDFVEGKVDLSNSRDGGEIGYLTTKVEGVNLKLWYPKNEKLPKASLTIDDLKEVTQ